MTENGLAQRFLGVEGNRRLVDAIRSQDLLRNSPAMADALATVVELVEVAVGDDVIQQGAADNDLYLIISGTVGIRVNDREVATRRGGQHIGDMAMVDPSARRSATVRALEAGLLARVSEADFVKLANGHPDVWRRIAIELGRRLDERKRFHRPPNQVPVLFVGSSSELLPIAKALSARIPESLAEVRLWSMDGIFEASSFPIEDLERQLGEADFAVLVAGADDEVISRGKQMPAPRDNVVFEAGLFMGALSRGRTYLLAPKGQSVKIPSDLLGMGTLRFDPVAADPVAGVADACHELARLIAAKGPR